jgi:glycosyltransferase involved in cell wall biosynthesis
LLIPSLEETAPVALGEACAVGLPAVGSDAGGIPYMIHDGETGYVRPMRDVEGMAERVVAILKDDELRSRLSSRAKAIGLQDFSMSAIVGKTLTAYQEILAG